MRIGLIEFLLILAIASLTIGPQVALFVDRWMRRANRANARAARRRAGDAAGAAGHILCIPVSPEGGQRRRPAGAGAVLRADGPDGTAPDGSMWLLGGCPPPLL